MSVPFVVHGPSGDGRRKDKRKPGEQPSDPDAKPQPDEKPKSGAVPVEAPVLDPAPGSPPVWEVPFPVVLPDIVVTPGPSVTPKPDTPPKPGTDPGTSPGTNPGTGPGTNPGTGPGTDPGPGTQPPGPPKPPKPKPSAGASVTIRPPSHKYAPPSPKQKEGKVNVRRKYRFAFVAVNLATESLDFVDSVFKGLPTRLQRKCSARDYTCKLEVLYEEWEYIDLGQAVEAFLNNQIEDFAYAALGKVAGKATVGLNVTTGLGKAINAGQDAAADAEQEAKAAGEEYDEEINVDNPLPEMVYDSATGKVRWIWPMLGIN